MLATLDVPYVDTRAAELVWTLDHPVVPALAMTSVPLARLDAALELRVLGASHQVVLRDSRDTVVETVACLAGQPAHLPDQVERRVGGWTYRFRARVELLPADALRERARSLRRLAEEDGGQGATVVAAFPSDPDAVTALSLGSSARGVAWDTWHVYPNSRQIVTTSSEVIA